MKSNAKWSITGDKLWRKETDYQNMISLTKIMDLCYLEKEFYTYH